MGTRISNLPNIDSVTPNTVVVGVDSIGTTVKIPLHMITPNGIADVTAAFNKANTANQIAISAFNKANTVELLTLDVFNQACTAFTQANTANQIAIMAYGQANTVLLISNSAYTQANTANNNAINAYGQANAAYLKANTNSPLSAFVQANTANEIAIMAFNRANTANGIADVTAAYTQANTSNQIAIMAFNRANTANTLATAALPSSGGSVSGTIVMNNYGITLVKTLGFVGEYDNGSSGTFTLSNGQKQKATFSANTTVNIVTTGAVPSTYQIRIIQDGTGNRAVTWGAALVSTKWVGTSTPPTVNTNSNGETILSIAWNGSTITHQALARIGIA